jgi:Arc/MetJ family transcription regulator
MRTTVALDDELLARAQDLTGVCEKSVLLREALRALIQRESAKRLALLGDSKPRLEDVPRRQTDPAWSSSTPRSGSTIVVEATSGCVAQEVH